MKKTGSRKPKKNPSDVNTQQSKQSKSKTARMVLVALAHPIAQDYPSKNERFTELWANLA
jgi:hypothetical protein